MDLQSNIYVCHIRFLSKCHLRSSPILLGVSQKAQPDSKPWGWHLFRKWSQGVEMRGRGVKMGRREKMIQGVCRAQLTGLSEEPHKSCHRAVRSPRGQTESDDPQFPSPTGQTWPSGCWLPCTAQQVPIDISRETPGQEARGVVSGPLARSWRVPSVPSWSVPLWSWSLKQWLQLKGWWEDPEDCWAHRRDPQGKRLCCYRRRMKGQRKRS